MQIPEDIVWRISIDDSRASMVNAGVVVPFFAGVRAFTTLIPPPYDWEDNVVRSASSHFGSVSLTFNTSHPRRLRRPGSSHTATEQLSCVIDQQVMPYLQRFTSLQAVLDELTNKDAAIAREPRGHTVSYFNNCEAALMHWRSGGTPQAEAALDRADASIQRIMFPSVVLWPPRDWFRREPDPEVEKFADATYAEQKRFVQEVRNFVRQHDPAMPVVPVPLWPGLAEVTRTWRADSWGKGGQKTPWAEPTLRVDIHDEDAVGIMYGPTATGTSEACLGPGPAYFDDDAQYDVHAAARDLVAWAFLATGAQPDLAALRTLIAPSSSVDLVEALTELCRLLALGLPKP